MQSAWLTTKKTNLPSLLSSLSRRIQTQILFRLSNELGYQHLRLSFEAYIALIEPAGSRQSTISRMLNVSKQNCNQIVKDIESAGYLKRVPDPEDGRGKLLLLTPLGHKLRQDGNNTIVLLEKQLLAIAGKAAFSDAKTSLILLSEYFAVPLATIAQGDGFSSLLFRFNHFATQTLFAAMSSGGHSDIRPSYGQVLENISRRSMSIQQLARINNVSKQAIGAIASRLEQLGYISRHSSSSDGRQILLALSPEGEQLLKDSVFATDQLYLKMQQALGKSRLTELENTLQTICTALAFENTDNFSSHIYNNPDGNIDAIAKQLIEQMGNAGAENLAKTLLQILFKTASSAMRERGQSNHYLTPQHLAQ
jgi:DNA-binding MarR family transcriptional regulator